MKLSYPLGWLALLRTSRRCFGAFAKLRNATVSLCPSVRMEQLGFHWMDFHEIWYWRTFLNSIEKIQVSLKSDKNKGHFTWRPIFIFLYLAHFFLEWEMFPKKVVEKIKNTYFVFSTFFFENSAVYKNMWKNTLQRGRPQVTIWRMRISL